ncbi:MAG: CDP-diacylglycerol--glycerol-3-phosphate 3-phosphatidyltransferase [Hyphomicrobiaceae bacterium]|nr:CDP-diacylglycerol--glycerol-3-phosphate 3-phosphatidyltransferase [Hyphomicrobiaceae bacterium]
MPDDIPPPRSVLTWPTVLTLARIAAVPALVAAMLLWPGAVGRWLALAIFVGAALTDWLDGYLARALDQQSRLGAMLDPIADKLIVAAALVMLVAEAIVGDVHVVPVIAILTREILVSGVREVLAADGVGLPVSRLAKWKTAAQMAAIALLLAPFPASADHVADPHRAGLVLLWLAAALTVQTGASYLTTAVRHAMRGPGERNPDRTP